MKLLKSKTGKFKFDPSNAGQLVQAIILLVIALRVFAVGLPEIAEAGNEVSSAGGNGSAWDTRYPLTSLFASDNVLILAVVGGVIVAVVLAVMPSKKR